MHMLRSFKPICITLTNIITSQVLKSHFTICKEQKKREGTPSEVSDLGQQRKQILHIHSSSISTLSG